MGNLISDTVSFILHAMQQGLIWAGILFLPMLGSLQEYSATAIATYSNTYDYETNTYNSNGDRVTNVNMGGHPTQVYLTIEVALSNTSTTAAITLRDVTLLDANNLIVKPQRPRDHSTRIVSLADFFPISDSNRDKALSTYLPPISIAKGVLEYAIPAETRVSTLILTTASGQNIRIPVIASEGTTEEATP